MQKDRKMEPKSEQKLKKCEKGNPKIDAKNDAKFGGVKNDKMPESIAPWSPRARFWSQRGVWGNGETGFDSDLV